MTIYSNFIRAIHLLDPEVSHALSHMVLRNIDLSRFLPTLPVNETLSTKLAGIPLRHPVGLAAGFDKNGESLHGLSKLGFSFIEVGTVTPRPQYGNPRPRIFKDTKHQILINRMGFNSAGAAVVAANLRRQLPCPVPLGINIGPNKDTRDVIGDFCYAWQTLAELADYVTINISSPNTPGLRSWLSPSALETLLAALTREREKSRQTTPLFVKLSPDRLFHHDEKRYKIMIRHGVSGVILSNTSRWRPKNLPLQLRGEKGGLSGRPLLEKTLKQVGNFAKLNSSALPIMASGGIDNRSALNQALTAGASAVQVYSGLIFKGPRIVHDMLAGYDNHQHLEANRREKLTKETAID